MIGKTISHYKILEKLGEGGMGVVYKARDTKLDRFVALKFLPQHLSQADEEKKRFIHEAKAASALDHPNICTVYEINETEDGQMFIAMACYEGNDLVGAMHTSPLPIDHALDYAIQVAEGLQAAHKKDIIHRDIKPANILLTEDKKVKIVDFGLAKLAGMTKLTKEGTSMGTVAYMSPEQTQGVEVDHRTDIWALGAVIYEMVSGLQPFKGDYEQAVMYSIMNEDPEPMTGLRTGVPMELERIVNKCLAKNTKERYQHADELLVDLRRLRKESTGIAIPTAQRPTIAKKPIWRQPFSLIVAALVTIVLSIGAWWLANQGGEKPTAGAPQNSIAVMYFENLTGDPALAWIEAGMVEMLTANLGRFENLNVLSSQRLFDIMRQVSGKAATQIDRVTATRIAEKAGVRTMLLGSVIGTQSQMRLNAQLVEVATGRLVGSEVLDAGSSGSLFSVVDSLTWRIADHLQVRSADQPVEVNVAYTLTNSPDALRSYVNAVQSLYRSRYTHATAQFEAAVKADSTFAMAYYHLSTARAWLGGTGKRQALSKARQYMDKVSEREGLLIKALLLQDFQERRKAFEQIVARYPNEKFAWYELCELLFHSYWLRAAVEASLRAVELDPYFLLAYIHPIDFYMGTGQFSEATPLLAKALSLDSLNLNSLFCQAYLNCYEGNTVKARAGFAQIRRLAGADSLGTDPVLAKAYLAMMERDYRKAEAILEVYRKKATGYHVVYATDALAALAAFQGKYELAERTLRQAVDLRPNSVFLTYETGFFALLRGRTEVTRTNGEQLVDWHSSGAQPFVEVATLGRHLLFLAALAKGEMEKAQQAISELRTLVVGQKNAYDFLFYDALGRLASRKGNLREVQKHFARALTTATFFSTDVVISFRILIQDGLMECLERGRAYQTLLQHADKSLLAAGQILPPHPNFLFSPSTIAVSPRTLLRQAHAYEALGERQNAIAAYEKFLDLWKNADEDLPDFVDANTRYAKLKGRTEK